ncbi:hypothetical protein [Kitasatospora sp. NPDC051914]|uniref:hypothetical protein n=1 Tax=Kitasatospora sp. NPDC051914 TaxID=3154945 RepID=UPI00341E427B
MAPPAPTAIPATARTGPGPGGGPAEEAAGEIDARDGAGLVAAALIFLPATFDIPG